MQDLYHSHKDWKSLFKRFFGAIVCNGLVYELWRVLARTSPNKNRLWKIRRIFQVRTDRAIAYIRCYMQAFPFALFWVSAFPAMQFIEFLDINPKKNGTAQIPPFFDFGAMFGADVLTFGFRSEPFRLAKFSMRGKKLWQILSAHSSAAMFVVPVFQPRLGNGWIFDFRTELRVALSVIDSDLSVNFDVIKNPFRTWFRNYVSGAIPTDFQFQRDFCLACI